MNPYITSDIATLLSPEQRLSVVEKLTEELMRPVSIAAPYIWPRPVTRPDLRLIITERESA